MWVKRFQREGRSGGMKRDEGKKLAVKGGREGGRVWRAEIREEGRKNTCGNPSIIVRF
jgi:hypothetical protein